MYDINTKNVKKGYKTYSIFLLAGVIFAGILIFVLLLSTKNNSSLDKETTATRVDLNEHFDSDGNYLYSPVYYFRVGGKEYSCGSESSSSIKPSSNAKVYYDSKNPSNCKTDFTKRNNVILLVALLLPAIFIFLGISNILKIKKRVALITELNQKGKLVKNLKYHLENTGLVVNNVPIQRPVVEYTLSSGSTVTLYGDPRNDNKLGDSDGMVDLVIDENNPNNYYIDYEINRLTGNLDSDYYKDETVISAVAQGNVVANNMVEPQMQNNAVVNQVPNQSAGQSTAPTLEESAKMQQNVYNQYMDNNNQNM